MVYKIKKLNNNSNASTGVMLVLIPFIITIILSVTFIPLGDQNYASGISFFLPETYENMTYDSRNAWFQAQHGGLPEKEWRWGWSALPSLGEWWYVFPDGTEITYNNYQKYKEGNAGQPDYYQVTLQVLTINPKALDSIGIYGFVLRVIMIASVCIGLVELIWIG